LENNRRTESTKNNSQQENLFYDKENINALENVNYRDSLIDHKKSVQNASLATEKVFEQISVKIQQQQSILDRKENFLVKQRIKQ
jgi:metal-dependent HD superfamily phosphatase/phosphodiesterase